MSRVRALLTLVALLPIAHAAHAQPVDPYKPAPADPYKPEPTPAPAPPAAPKAPPAGPAEPPPASKAPPAAPAEPPPASPQPAPGSTGPSSGAPAPAPRAPGTPAEPHAPLDPYALPPGQDVVLAERVAQALVARAQDLLDGRVFLDAKQLAVEALVKSPKGPAAEHARAIIHAVNRELGIPEDSPRPEPPGPVKPTEDTDTSPIQDPTLSTPPAAVAPEGRWPSRRITATVHGGLYAGLLGTTIGSFFSHDTPAAGAVPVGIAFGVAGGIALPLAIDKLGWSEAQIRTVGAATVWGGVIGGLFGDIAKVNGTTAREVLVPAALT